MTAEQMWAAFAAQAQIAETEYDAWAFGAQADELAELVLAGVKTATASAGPLYELDNEPLPRAGEYSVILNAAGEAVCVIQTTKVYVCPFRAVTAQHAYMEGEGDRSLACWRQVHETFFRSGMERAGLVFDEDMPVVCEEFRLVYPGER